MKKLIILSFTFIFSLAALSQDPIHWEFSSKKTGETTYEIHFVAKVESPWHTYSQTTPEGGPLPTKIVFTKNPLILLEGKTIEKGELKKVHDNVFDVDVKYFESDVEFVQTVKLKAKVKTSVTGNVQFMACNDHQCLPPKTIPFTIQLQ